MATGAPRSPRVAPPSRQRHPPSLRISLSYFLLRVLYLLPTPQQAMRTSITSLVHRY